MRRFQYFIISAIVRRKHQNSGISSDRRPVTSVIYRIKEKNMATEFSCIQLYVSFANASEPT